MFIVMRILNTFMNNKSFSIKILISAGFVIVVTIIYFIVRFIDIIPYWVKWNEKAIKLDFLIDSDLKDEFVDSHIPIVIDTIELKNKILTVYSNKKEVFTTEERTKVQDFLYFDIDNDNKKDLVLLVWEKEKFRDRVPFFEKNVTKWDQHIFIYNVCQNKVTEKWLGSYIKDDIISIHNVKNNILTVITTNNKRVDLKYRGFGLKVINESKFDYVKELDSIKSVVSINCFGDNLIHKKIYDFYLKNNIDFYEIYKNIKIDNDECDISVINHETMLVDSENEYSDFPRFGTPLDVGYAIKKAGFDVVTLANNHSLDKYDYGIVTTVEFYKKNGIKTIGVDSNDYVIFNKNGIKICMMNYTYGINNENEYPDELLNRINILPRNNDDLVKFKNKIRKLKEKTDVIIMFLHWGSEYKTEIDNFQKKWTKILLDLNVDIVIGTHPHVVQKKEIFKDKNNEMLVYYSLGNFISYQTRKETLRGMEARFKIAKTKFGIKIMDILDVPLVTYIDRNTITTKKYED